MPLLLLLSSLLVVVVIVVVVVSVIFYVVKVDCEVLTQLAHKNKFQQLQQHLSSLVVFYSQGGGPNCEHSNMYYVITSLESMLLSITKMMR